MVLVQLNAMVKMLIKNYNNKFEGLFRKSALITIRMAKNKGKLLRTVFSLVLRDPTCTWDKIRSKMNVRSQEESPIVLQKQSNMLKEDRRAGKYKIYSVDSQTLFFFSSRFDRSPQTSALLRQGHEKALHSIQLPRFADKRSKIG